MAGFNLSSTELNEIQNHDDFRVVWFSSDYNVPQQLTQLVDYLEKCHSFDACDNYIKRFKTERKIFLVLIYLFEHLSYFNDLPQIQSIYVLENSPQNIKDTKANYSKLVNIFTDEQKLIERLRQDILLTYRNDLPITISCLNDIKIEQSLMSLERTALIFIWNQLFTYYLVNSSDIDMEKLKQDMIEQCQLEYAHDQTELTKISDFDKNCTLDNVLEWYTKGSFVYRLVNKAFRIRNIDLICKFRYFIILLYKKLKELLIQQQQQRENYTTVYRGQTLGQNDLKNLQSNIGHLISFNTMMSTSRNPAVARLFISGSETDVIFEINIVHAGHNTLHPFADISRFRLISDEEEILFFTGAVFRINSIEKSDDSITMIKLTLSNGTVDQIEHLNHVFEKQLTDTASDENPFLLKADDVNLFGKYFKILIGESYSWKNIFTYVKGIDFPYVINILGNYERTIAYYKELLANEQFIDQPKSIVLHIMIGYNYSHLLEYQHALFHYGIALSSLDEKNRLTGELYNHIGDVWKAANNFESALSCYEEALKVLTSHSIGSRFLAIIYQNISYIHRKQNIYLEAIIYEEQANELKEPLKESSQFDIENSLKHYQNQFNTQPQLSPCEKADILYQMGVCLTKKGDYSQALEKLLSAKQLFETDLSPSNRLTQTHARLYESIALVYLHLKDNFNAFVMLKKATDIRTSFSSN